MNVNHRVTLHLTLLLCIFVLFMLSGCAAEEPTEPTEPTTPSIKSELEKIDGLLERTVPANIAYNVPRSMLLDETIEIQLLLSPSLSVAELEQQIAESGTVVSSAVNVTPWMRAELKSVAQMRLISTNIMMKNNSLVLRNQPNGSGRSRQKRAGIKS